MHTMSDESRVDATTDAAPLGPDGLPSRVGPGDAGAGALSVTLTQDHRYRVKALNVPGAYYSRDRKAYVVDNPSPRAAATIIAFFPEALIEHPELVEIRERGYGAARPYDYASELDLRLDVGPLGDKSLYDWQSRDTGYLSAILKRDGGAFLGWDRGLGKTLATAAFARAVGARRVLVVARNDAKDAVWRAQLEEALPEYRILVLPNEQKKRERLIQEIEVGEHDDEPFVLIVHYEAIRVIAGDRVVEHTDGTSTVTKAGGNGWKRLGTWDLMAYDEGHRLASYNPNSKKNTQMGRALSKLRAKHVKLAVNLTGSGVMNRAEDLFGQLHYLFPKIYRAKWADWNDRFVDFVDDGNRQVAIGWKAEALPQLRKELGVFMVHRKKSDPDIAMSLPPLIKQDIELDLYTDQRRAYEEMRDQFWTMVEGGSYKTGNAAAQLSMLRQIATYVPGLKGPSASSTGSVKLDFALSELEENPDEQFIIFTWFKAPGRALAERLGDEVVVVDGDVPIRHRPELLAAHRKGQARVLIGSIATLGESLNLQYAHEAIRLDRDWNPEVNGQTVDRLHRQGQQTRVTMRDLWARNTVDVLRVRPNLASKESLRKAVFG